MKRAILDALRAARRERRSVALMTTLDTGAQELIGLGAAESSPIAPPPSRGRSAARSVDGWGAAATPLRHQREGVGSTPHAALPADLPPKGGGGLTSAALATGVETADGREIFTHVFRPTLRLVVVGAVHIAQKLVPLARLADFAVTVVDPRTAFASAQRFPDVGLSHDWPDRAVATLSPDAATAIVTLSHDPKLDDPALIAALRSAAFYIGALGSRKSHAKRLERLRAEGFDAAALARIRAPVGLPIGAASPGEIAVSILAEIVAVHHRRALRAAEG